MNRSRLRSQVFLAFGILAFCGIGEAFAARAAKPTFNKAHGFYSANFTVTISTSTPGATMIRYTTDGSKPSASYGTVGTSVLITKTTCLRACASGGGFTASQVMTATYIFVNDVVSQTGPSGWPSSWGAGHSWLDYTGWADYHMDTTISSTAVKNGLQALPSVCIAMPKSDMFNYGQIYGGGDGAGDLNVLEKEASFEFIPAGGGTGVQQDCTMKSHSWRNAKRTLRVLFKSRDGGPATLSHDIFANTPNSASGRETTFGKLILRAGMNYGWGGYPAGEPDETVYARDQWTRDSQIAMSGFGCRGDYMHVYINGLYWGLYNVVERPDARWAATYFGGSKSDYDAINHGRGYPYWDDGRLVSGAMTRWNSLHSYVAANSLTGSTQYNWVAARLDLTDFADYLILNAYLHTDDWPRGNFYACYPSGGKLFYICWDAEISMPDASGWPTAHQAYIDGDYKIGTLAKKLLLNTTFKQLLTQRVKLHCQGTGVLTDSKARARWDNLCNRIVLGIDAEAARWGDHMVRSSGHPKYTKTTWTAARGHVYNRMGGAASRLISAFQAQGWWDDSGDPPPDPPNNLVATNATVNSIEVSWDDNSSDEDGFKLDRRQSGLTAWDRVATTGANDTSETDTGLAETTKYYYKVKAYNANGDSTYSNIDDATTLSGASPPDPPTGLSASAVSTTQINLAWTDQSSDEAGFRIDRRQSGSTTWTVPLVSKGANVESHSDTGLLAATKYYYQVRAYNADGESANTPIADATTDTPLPPPAAPTNLTATAVSSSQIDLTWQDQSSDEAGFRIDRRQTGTTVWVVPVATVGENVESHSDSGLLAEMKYYYRVRAYNGNGESSNTAVADDTTFAEVQPPAPPTNLFATAVSSTQINLLWDDQSADETGFRIDRRQTGETVWTVPFVTVGLNASTYTDDGLPAETRFYYRVRSYNVGGESANTAVADATTLAALQPPAAPTNLTATAMSSTRIDLAWDDQSDNEDGFRLDRRQTGDPTWTVPYVSKSANTSTHSDTGLPAETKFYYRVRAYNAAGESANTAVDDATTTAGSQEGVAKGADWRYHKGTVEASDPGADWREFMFDDSGWFSGAAPFGYASGGWPTGTDLDGMRYDYLCVFLRHIFTIANPAVIEQLSLDIDFDDGFIAWVNGEEVARVHMAGAPGTFIPFSSNSVGYVNTGSSNWTATLTGGAIPALYESNVFAVQVFNIADVSSDLMMNPSLSVALAALAGGEDVDADVMPDAWEVEKLGNTNQAAQVDGDNDGVSNIGEYIGGTDPGNSNQFFAVSVQQANGDVIVSFPTFTATGTGYVGLTRYYALQQKELDGLGGWAPVPGYGQIPAGGTVSYTNTGGVLNPMLFRGRTWLEE